MSPSLRRYIQTEQDIWAFLWRFMPKACKEVKVNRPVRISCEYRNIKRFVLKVK